MPNISFTHTIDIDLLLVSAVHCVVGLHGRKRHHLKGTHSGGRVQRMLAYSRQYEWYADAILINKQTCRGLGPSLKPAGQKLEHFRTCCDWRSISRNWNRRSVWVTATTHLVVIRAALLTKREVTNASTLFKRLLRPLLLIKPPICVSLIVYRIYVDTSIHMYRYRGAPLGCRAAPSAVPPPAPKTTHKTKLKQICRYIYRSGSG